MVSDPPAKAFGQRVEDWAAAAVQNRWDQNQIPSKEQQEPLKRGMRRGHFVGYTGGILLKEQTWCTHTPITCFLPGQSGDPGIHLSTVGQLQHKRQEQCVYVFSCFCEIYPREKQAAIWFPYKIPIPAEHLRWNPYVQGWGLARSPPQNEFQQHRATIPAHCRSPYISAKPVLIFQSAMETLGLLFTFHC